MFELKILTRFAAAHQLKMVGQKCENLHGHNWKVEVCVGGEKLNRAGVLMDFGDIKRHVAEIMKELDHRFLNEADFFGPDIPPSSENIALYIFRQLRQRITEPGVNVTRVSAWESDDSCATCIAD
ncbi:MAG: 6-carboxytetrahydropterin synthase QueD [Desulfobacterales bacterium]